YPWGAKELGDLLPNERVGVLPWELTKLFGMDLKAWADKLVVRQPVTVQNRKYHSLHRLLRCIDKNILLSKLPVEAQAGEEETFPAPGELLEKLKGYPFLVTNTYKLMDACNIEMDFAEDKTKQT